MLWLGLKLQGSAASKDLSGFIPVIGASQPASVVAFDVALTATEGTGSKGGIGVVAGIVSLGTAGHSNNENTSVSRVQFSIPVVLPNENS